MHLFLSKIHKEFQRLVPSHNLEVYGDIDELISLKQMVKMTLKSKIQGLVKYKLLHCYMKSDLMQLIENISRSLSLLNLVDKTLGIQIWYETFDSTLSTYFFYFLFINKESFNSWDWRNPVQHRKILQFQQEIERLTSFFENFVKGKHLEKVMLRSKMMVEYLRSTDTQAAMGFLRSLITTSSIKSNQSLKNAMQIKKQLLDDVWFSLEGQCQHLIDMHHIEMSGESIKMICSVPVMSFLRYVRFSGWIYKKCGKVGTWFSKTKSQGVYEGYKPYWAKLHKKTLYLFYDETMKEMKCMYYMPLITDLQKQGKTKITFTNQYDHREHMTFKFDDHCMRNDWYHLIEVCCNDKNYFHEDHRVMICEAMDERRPVLQKGILTQLFDLDHLTQVIDVKPDTPEIIEEVYQAIENQT